MEEVETEFENSAEIKAENRAENEEMAGGMPRLDRATLSELLVQVGIQMDARTLATDLAGVFAAHAWRAMGLVANPMTGEIETDLAEAQLAIDCVHFLLGKIEKDLPDGERREMQRRLNDLRMNYLERARK